MPEENSLILNVESRSVSTAAKELAKLEKSSVGVEKATDGLASSQKGLKGDIDKNRKATDGFAGNLTNLAKRATVATAAFFSIRGVLRGGLGVLQASAEIETLETGFISLTGSVQAAEAQVRGLIDFTASTPFQLEGVSNAARQLITARGSAEGLNETLQILGDISSTSNIPIEELAAIYTKTFNKGKLQAEELNQISERGIPIMKQLADQMGVAREEIFQLGSEGKIRFEDLEEAFVNFTSEGGFAFDAMQRQSLTLSGKISTLKDNVKLSSASIGDNLAEAFNVSGILDDLTRLSQKVAELAKDDLQRARELTNINDIYERQSEIARIIEEAQKRNLSLDNSRNAAGRVKNDQIVRELELEQKILTEKFEGFSQEEKQIAERQRQIKQNAEEERQIILGLTTLRKNRRGATTGSTTRELTQEEATRIEQIKEQNRQLEEQVLKIQEIKEESKEKFVDSGALSGFLDLQKELRTSSEIIEDQFNERIARIDEYQTSLEKAGKLTIEKEREIDELRERAFNAKSSDSPEVKEKDNRKLESLKASLLLERETVDLEYEQQRLRLLEKHEIEADILKEAFENKQLSELEYQALSAEHWGRHNATLEEMNKQRLERERDAQLLAYSTTIGMAQNLMGQLNELGVQSKTADKVLFAASQGMAIANAIINTEEAYSKALTLGPVIGPIVGGATRALGYASVATIAATTVGNFASGGIIDGSVYSGDRLNANVNSGEMILNRQQQANLFQQINSSNSGGSDGKIKVNIINQTNTQITSETVYVTRDEVNVLIKNSEQRSEQIYGDEARAKGIRSGADETSRAFEDSFGLRRVN